jgi:hypothetical protein
LIRGQDELRQDSFVLIISRDTRFERHLLTEKSHAANPVRAADRPYAPNFIRGGDAAFHIFNTQQFAAGLREDVLYPRWFGDFYNGYGARVGIGYAPLTYYGGSLFMLLGYSVFTALKTLLTITLIIGGLGMYRLASRFFADSRGDGGAGLSGNAVLRG